MSSNTTRTLHIDRALDLVNEKEDIMIKHEMEMELDGLS